MLVVMSLARLLVLAALIACRDAPEMNAPPSEIVDQSASVEALQHAFNARRGEPRFLALLAPS
jgi:hypothetical protein